jgi:hypothetical protein
MLNIIVGVSTMIVVITLGLYAKAIDRKKSSN